MKMKSLVLIADSEYMICESFLRSLSGEFVIHYAHDRSAIFDAMGKSNTIDILLFDINMPGMAVTDVIDEIRVDNKDVVIIVIADKAKPERVCAAMRRGADNYLLKPLNPLEVQTGIKNVIKNKMSNAEKLIYC
jgi:DNA-binding NtrC family response regulator